MKFVELFAGIGGFRLGLEAAGMTHAWSNEINEEACLVYGAAHKACGEVVCGDVREIPSSAIPDHDVLTAGFPCQPFSNAGKNRGLDDARGTLFFEVARILRDKKPAGAILENVPGLVTNNGGRTFGTIISILADCGYECDFAVLNSVNFGVPQARERVYIVALRRDKCPFLAPSPGRRRTLLERKARATMPLLDIIPDAPATTSCLREIEPRIKIVIPEALENRLREKVALRPRSLLRVRDNRTGFQSIPTWQAELFGPVTEAEKAMLESMRTAFQKEVYDRLADDEPRHGTPQYSADEFGTTDSVLESLATRGYIRRRPSEGRPRYSLINRNLLPGGVPSCYGGPLSAAPTLTASNLSQFAMVMSDGVYQVGPGEFEAIQGFPPGFTDKGVPKKSRLRLVGNSVVPQVVEWVGRVVANYVR
jgi:DNA (cytosine-5)-methyltransferase 1